MAKTQQKKTPNPTTKAKAPAKKPKKGVYVAPSPDDWGTKPALLKLASEFGKHAAAVHKLQHDLRAAKAKLKKYREAIDDVRSLLHTVGQHDLATKLRNAVDALEN